MVVPSKVDFEVVPRQSDDEAVRRMLVNAGLSVKALGNAVGALQVQASPQAARAVQATENLVRSVEEEFGLLTSTEAGTVLGSVSSAASRNLTSSKHRSGELLSIRRGYSRRFPGFQFDKDGASLPVIKTLLTMCGKHGWTEADLFLWLVTPAGVFDGSRPVDVLLANQTDQLVDVALTEMSAEW